MDELVALKRLHDVLLWRRGDADGYCPRYAADRRRRRIRNVAGVAAVIIILLVVEGIYMSRLGRQTPETGMQTIRVPAGQRAELTLADGTSVWLNAGSTLVFPTVFGTDRRCVTLDGEGYFTVTADRERPFVVETPSYDITVLGTEFNVLSYGNSSLFEVSLLSGEVEISSGEGARALHLAPRTRAFRKDDRLVTEAIYNEDYLLWKDGLICFDDELIDFMISKLELYYDTRITVRNEAFRKKRYTGKFRTKDGIEHILKVFQLKETFTYEKDDEKNEITIY
jgi:ferric-dicitrate binding protein FerR (iron transport regulator)